jgi:monofunctional biosynthetic peptidoglycan transglycosylase
LRRAIRLVVIALLVGPALVLLAVRFVPPPATALMLLRSLQGHPIDYRWVPLARMARHVPRVAIASEDNLFCQHWGFDVDGLKVQVERLLAGEAARGASTISQQTVKNLFLWDGRDPLRKLIEAWLTPQLELLLGKRRILELYLNVVELGPGLYGVEAAARRYFKKPAAKVSLQEAAYLVAVLPAPLRWSPAKPSPRVRERARVAAQRVDQLGPLLDCAG